MSQFPAPSSIGIDPREVIHRRTLILDSAGRRFREGPVPTGGRRLASLLVRNLSTTVLSTGVVDLQGGIEPGSMQSFETAETINASTMFLNEIGGFEAGVRGLSWLDASVSTAQSGVELEFLFTLRDATV